MNSVQFISILIAAVLFTAVLIWDVETDLKKWKNNIAVKHAKEWWLRVALLLPTIILLTVAHPQENGYSWATLKVLLTVGWFVSFLWWLLFDGIYNNRRGYGWWFRGSFNDKGHRDSWFDGLQEMIGTAFSIFLKVGGVLAPLLMYIISFIKHS